MCVCGERRPIALCVGNGGTVCVCVGHIESVCGAQRPIAVCVCGERRPIAVCVWGT